MSISISNRILEKLEQLLKDLGYSVRNEKVIFKTGSCLIENIKIVVVNKFINLESKIDALTELIKSLNFEEALPNEKQKTFNYSLKQSKLQL